MTKSTDYSAIFWLHLLVNLTLIFSWLIFSWQIVLLGSLFLQIQYLVFGGCILSRLEFGRKEDCMVYYMSKWGCVKDKKYARKFVERELHILVIVLALLWQIALGFSPLIF